MKNPWDLDIQPEKVQTREEMLVACLRDFRRLMNETVRDTREVARVHRMADRLLATDDGQDDPDAQYDAPHRVEHRRFVERVLRHDY